MASSLRQLLHTDGEITSDGNRTVDHNTTIQCIANCIGVCIYGVCLPSPPLSPTPLPYGDVSGNATTQINLHSRNRLLPILIITAITSVATSFLLLLALYAYLRFRHDHRRRSMEANGATSAVDDDDDLIQGSEMDHHIWYIRTQGLEEGTILSIPSFVYRSSDGLVDGRDCSVCLGDFRDGELARLLPKCRHAFHLPCIDRWLSSHLNCPLCRSPIVSLETAAVSAPSPASPSTSSGQIHPEIGSPVLVENITEIEVLPWKRNRQGSETEIDIQVRRGSPSRSSSSDLPHNSAKGEEGLQPIRRSVSMDSCPMDVLVNGGRREGKHLQMEDKYASANGGKPWSCTKENLRRKLKESAKMERSLSSQSARWFFSRYGRSRNFVPPL